jgi:soluble lytic murein transglycosylase-like protein
MPKARQILGKMGGQKRILKLVTNTLAVGLLLVANGWSQETGSSWSVASVDQSFTALNQALSATADDLLAGTQRQPAVRASDPQLPASQPTSALDSPAASQAERNIHLQQALRRVQVLRPALEPILREEEVPPQMAAVALVESGGRVTALSPKGARGLWQIMPDTARRYGLVVSAALDERLDLYKSTRAAAHYLRDLHTQFGDWPLALAAYNAGADAVQKAIDHASSRDFTLIARAGMLPLETRNYVPAVLSAMGILKRTDGTSLTTRVATTVIERVVYAMDHTGTMETYEQRSQ